jgi:iron complex transport system permease protein
MGFLRAIALLVTLVLVAFSVSRYPVSPGQLWALLWAKVTGSPSALPASMETVVFRVRGPRVVSAIAIGATLAAAGSAYQGLFRNPLVSPDILGVSTGAALGATLGIFFSWGVAGIQGLAFALGLAAVAVVYVVGAALRRHDPILVLVLAGIVIGTLLGSCISLLKYLADPYNQLPAITFWLFGSLSAITMADVLAILPGVLVGLIPLLLRWRMNVMTLSEEEALTLGVHTRRVRLTVIAAATLMTAAVVSVSGVIGWIGLLIPHFARLLVGPDFPRLLPAAMLLGAGYLVAVDTLARTIAPLEIPLGVLTAFIGAPFFIWLLAVSRPGWQYTMRLDVADLAFGYPGKEVGREVTFGLTGGEVLCLLGPNGGGKTTLFKTVLRLLIPRHGRITVDGEPIDGWSCEQLARVFGYVPQAQLGVFPFTVAEIVLMGRTANIGPFAIPSRRDRAIAEEMLATLGIGHLAARPYTEISGGERQLTLIARALAQQPAILAMDEPTASLDFGNQVRILDEIEQLAGRGIAVMLSTHDPDHAFLCAHRVALLHHGRLARLGRPDEVITAESLREVYGVQVTITQVTRADGRTARVCVPALGSGGHGILPAHSGPPS